MTSAERPRILVTAPVPADLMERLGEHFVVHDMRPPASRDVAAVTAAVAGVEGFLLSQSMPISGELLDHCPPLRVISKVGVGYDKIDVEASTRRGVLVCNTPDVLNGAVADHTFAILLALTRRLRENEAHVRTGAWAKGPGHLGHDIRGKTLGIVGLGAIGRTVARTAAGFDMRVIYHNRHRDAQVESSGLARYSDRDALFREADVVSVHCPLTTDTRQSIGEWEFALMKPTSFFVNMSRGAVVDQAALVRVLEAGTIAGAALDVTDPEPLSADHPLCRLSNVVLTPHIGSGTHETRRAMHELAVDNLIRGLSGDLPRAPVNPQVLRQRT